MGKQESCYGVVTLDPGFRRDTQDAEFSSILLVGGAGRCFGSPGA